MSKADKVQAEERLHKYLFELKRPSDALFKALCNQEMRLLKFQEDNRRAESRIPVRWGVLSVAEENDIAVEVKQEKAMNDE